MYSRAHEMGLPECTIVRSQHATIGIELTRLQEIQVITTRDLTHGKMGKVDYEMVCGKCHERLNRLALMSAIESPLTDRTHPNSAASTYATAVHYRRA